MEPEKNLRAEMGPTEARRQAALAATWLLQTGRARHPRVGHLLPLGTNVARCVRSSARCPKGDRVDLGGTSPSDLDKALASSPSISAAGYRTDGQARSGWREH